VGRDAGSGARNLLSEHAAAIAPVLVDFESIETIDLELDDVGILRIVCQRNIEFFEPGDWNVWHVDFKAGVNTPTYKYYIDFASANKIEYVVLDEGWSDDWDLNKLKPGIDLEELIKYGKQKNVGLILWSTWYALSKDLEGLCKKYSEMGVKGFKVDFLDRNDQKMIASCYEMAAVAAKHNLMLDFHGMFPPQGLMTTWPNVINFEGVRGMEYSKWSADDRVPHYEVSIPFIRMVAGPMDDPS
jgi:alpha-glucosidase